MKLVFFIRKAIFGSKMLFWVKNAILESKNATFRSKFAIIRSQNTILGQTHAYSNSIMVVLGIFIQNWLRTGSFLVLFGSFLGHFRVIFGSIFGYFSSFEVIFTLKVEIFTIFEKILEMDSSTLNINFSVAC